MANIKELSQKPERLAPGHRMCGGCGATVAVRQVLMGVPDDVYPVVGCATGCLEVSTTIYPYDSWQVPFVHNAFENAAATVSGVEAAYKALKRAGKIPADKDEVRRVRRRRWHLRYRPPIPFGRYGARP